MAAADEWNLAEVCWWERRLPTAISAMALLPDVVLAGDWDGHIECWSFEGALRWRSEANDRIGQFAFSLGRDGGDEAAAEEAAEVTALYATAGRHLVRIDPEDGEIFWSLGLDGSADSVEIAEDGSVWVTSAVYDIELNDFIESACTLVSPTGEVSGRAVFDERPWHLEVRGEDALLGLGRPRSGGLILCACTETDGEGGKAEAGGADGDVAEDLDRLSAVRFDLGESPVTCGVAGREHTVFGHADGGLTAIPATFEEAVEVTRPFEARTAAIDGLICTESGVAVIDEEGVLSHLSVKGSVLWTVELPGGEDPMTEGPCSNDPRDRAVWATAWTGSEATLASFGHARGEQQTWFTESARIRALAADGGHLAVGLDDGRIHLLERGLLVRRLTADGEGSSTENGAGTEAESADERGGLASMDEGDSGPRAEDDDERRRAMRERLRSLREHRS